MAEMKLVVTEISKIETEVQLELFKFGIQELFRSKLG